MLRAPGLEIVLAEFGRGRPAPRPAGTTSRSSCSTCRCRGIDGYEVAGLIRSRPRSSRVPILFLTAYNKDDLHVFRGYSAGAVDYVFKPIEPLILKSKVDVFVDLYRKTEEIRRQGEEERRLLMENLRVRSEKLEDRAGAAPARGASGGRAALAARSRSTRRRSRRITGSCTSRTKASSASPASRREAFLERPDFWLSRAPSGGPGARARRNSRQLEEDGAVGLEYRWRCADGTDRYFLDQTVRRSATRSGRPREFFGMWFDVTERKQMEQSLLHASKLEAVGRLTGGIAHDFNNMLSVVIGNLDLLQKIDRRQREGRAARTDGASRARSAAPTSRTGCSPSRAVSRCRLRPST